MIMTKEERHKYYEETGAVKELQGIFDEIAKERFANVLGMSASSITLIEKGKGWIKIQFKPEDDQ